MSNVANAGKISRLIPVLLVANLFLWIYFGIAFARASYPYNREVWNYTVPTAPAGYTFFGHSLGVHESALHHLFFRVVFYAEFPSFYLARLGQNLLFPNVTGERFFARVSEGGWRLSIIALLSFFQWYLVGWLVQKVQHRWSTHPAASPIRTPPV